MWFWPGKEQSFYEIIALIKALTVSRIVKLNASFDVVNEFK